MTDTLTLTASDQTRVADVQDLETVCRALRAALHEIHNPGFARANNYDAVELIEQARTIVKRAIADGAPR